MLIDRGSIAFLPRDPRRAGAQPRPATELLLSALSPALEPVVTLSHPGAGGDLPQQHE